MEYEPERRMNARYNHISPPYTCFFTNPTTPLYLALGLTPLPMREIGAVIAPLPPGDEHEDLVNALPPQG